MSLTFALQSLLARHEAYVLDVEKERLQMTGNIENLECDKRKLEAANARTIEGNRNLLDQLESLNNAVSVSDIEIQSLNADLLSTRKELNRLTAMAARTAHLEDQLSFMELEQRSLHHRLALKEEGERSAMQRWKDAERTIKELQDQVDRIDRESKDERERHTELLGRLERRKTVEKELENAAGRLKGAAAVASMGKNSDINSSNNSSVVSHFVKDILADNANLQVGILELREMLMRSNEEVQNLRDQMLLHQKLPQGESTNSSTVTLKEDLEKGPMIEPEPMPALHVHHHYHEASKIETPARQRSVNSPRSRKRRGFITSGYSTPRSGSATPRTPCSRPTSSSVATILAQTAASVPLSEKGHPQRFSNLSLQTRSSIATSSVSDSTHPSLFDFATDSSRPTSPESIGPNSPQSIDQLTGDLARFGNKVSLHKSPSKDTGSQMPCSVSATSLESNPSDYDTIIEAPEEDLSSSTRHPEYNSSQEKMYSPNPRMGKSASHESIFSAAGVPSKQLHTRQSLSFRGSGSRSPIYFGSSLPTTGSVSSQPVIGASQITAAFTARNPARGERTVSSSAMSTLTTSLSQRGAAEKATLAKRVGGWVWGNWGVAHMASTENLRARAAMNAREARSPGVNQPGPIKGLGSIRRLSSHVEPVTLDERLLQESLSEA